MVGAERIADRMGQEKLHGVQETAFLAWRALGRLAPLGKG